MTKEYRLYSNQEIREMLYDRHVVKGDSVLKIAKSLGVSRDTVYRWCETFGVPTRSRSEANKVSMGKMTSEQRAERTKKANEARRGSTQSLEEKSCVAKGKELHAKMSKHEKRFAKWLIDAEITGFTFNYAWGPFNLDFAFPFQRIAVEVDGGNWHTTDRKKAQDDKKLAFLGSDWIVLRIQADQAFKENAAAVIDRLKVLL